MLLISPRGQLIIIGVCISLQGCRQATPEVANDQPAPVVQTQQAPQPSVTAEHIGAGPDQDTAELPPVELRREGERMVGDYIFAANGIGRPIIAERSPVQ